MRPRVARRHQPSSRGGVLPHHHLAAGRLGGAAGLARWVRSDDGSASIWLLAIGLAIVLLGAGLATAGAASVTRHRAEAAADLAALAAADQVPAGPATACRRAQLVATANSAHVTACRLDDFDAIVTVTVPMPVPFTYLGTATAASRAGPS
ncbi:Rv3654c family TadE-like protein [Fodinicola feengrottensis]|uniref:Rv3654c family TadE-like protein n=1 Tax=Fodinicola feengrottensis TaxID=435914 RepID=UPI0031D8484C